MKNIEKILSEAGITLTDEQKATVNNEVQKNYKPIADWQNQVDKVTSLESALNETKEALTKFDGVDVKDLNKQIKDLTDQIAQKDADYQKQIADRDFDSLVNDTIRDNGGVNSKAIKALLDIDKLKGSKNQKEDIASAIKGLTEADDSKMLFKVKEPVGTGSPIGTVGQASGGLSGVEKAFFDRTGIKVD